MDPCMNKGLLKCLEIYATRRARKGDLEAVPAQVLRDALTERIFARAADWVIELSTAVQLRY
eukprot:8289778-Lingulodinium_polyedra.AAC.1